MHTKSRHVSSTLRTMTLTALMFFCQESYSQDKSFAMQGAVELGGSIAFLSVTPVINGTTANGSTAFTATPFIGYFVADGLEIGVNPLGLATTSFSGNSFTQIMIFAAPSYNFKTGGIGYPFVEGLVGYTSQSGVGESLGGFSWGARGGVKLAVGGNGLLNIAMQYLQVTLNESGAAERSGTNQLTVSAGFTLWF